MIILIVCAVVGIVLFAALFFPSVFSFLGADAVSWLTQVSENYFSGGEGSGIEISPESLFAIFCIIVFVTLITRLCTFLNSVIKFENRRLATFKVLIFNSVKYLTSISAACHCLNVIGVNMVAVLAGLGVMGLIVGFGAQTLIEDVITGLFIVFEGQFSVGDIVSTDGYRGTVTNIGIRTTCITDVGGNVKILRNSDIKNVVNLSGKNSCAVVNMSITYSESIERAERVIKKALPIIFQSYPGIFEAEPMYVGVDALAASSVDLRVVAPVTEHNIFNARRILNRELKIAFDENKIEIPFPQVTVWQGSQE